MQPVPSAGKRGASTKPRLARIDFDLRAAILFWLVKAVYYVLDTTKCLEKFSKGPANHKNPENKPNGGQSRMHCFKLPEVFGCASRAHRTPASMLFSRALECPLPALLTNACQAGPGRILKKGKAWNFVFIWLFDISKRFSTVNLTLGRIQTTVLDCGLTMAYCITTATEFGVYYCLMYVVFFINNKINNKILDCDRSSARLFLT